MSKQKMPLGVGICLLDTPLTLDQLKLAVETSPFDPMPQSGTSIRYTRHKRRGERVESDLAELVVAGWVIQQGDTYQLTDLGREEIGKVSQVVKSRVVATTNILNSLVQPEMASRVTILVQIVLAFIKLPAGLLSGSVGLLNDSIDTILDLISSLLVFVGIRFDRERLVSILLVVFMVSTGGFTLYEAINRFFIPYVPKVDWFPFTAAFISAISGFLLWMYQRYIGLKYESMVFIAESVDSRNHVIISLSVSIGLVFSLLKVGILDMLVGLAVSLLIMWSAVGLAIDLLRSSPEKPVDLSHYGFWLQGAYDDRLKAYLRTWLLNLIQENKNITDTELKTSAQQAFDLRENSWLKSIGLNRKFVSDSLIEDCLDELYNGGWVVEQTPLILTEKGKEYLERQIRHHRFVLNNE